MPKFYAYTVMLAATFGLQMDIEHPHDHTHARDYNYV